MQQHVPQQPIEQMTFKLDIHGKILSLDPTALREPFKQHLQTWVGRLWQDLCHPHDLSTLKSHLRDIQDSASAHSPGSVGTRTSTLHIPNVVSRPFRLRLGAPDVYVHVKANSRLFLNQTPGEEDFIMSVQTLLNSENDMNSNNTGSGAAGGGLGLGQLCSMSPGPSLASSLLSSLSMDGLHGGAGSGSGSGSSSSPASGMLPTHLLGGLVGGGQQGGGGNSTQTTSVGGPLMSSAIINGSGLQQQQQQQRSGASSSTSSSANALVNAFTASPAPGSMASSGATPSNSILHNIPLSTWIPAVVWEPGRIRDPTRGPRWPRRSAHHVRPRDTASVRPCAPPRPRPTSSPHTLPPACRRHSRMPAPAVATTASTSNPLRLGM